MRLVFVPPTTSLAIAPDRLHALLVACSAPRDLAALEGRDLARALFAAPLEEPAADALDLVVRLDSAAGKQAIADAADAVGVDLGEARALAPADLAAHVVASRAREPRLRGVVRRALIALAELGAATPFAYERVAQEPRRARPIDEVAAILRAALAARMPGSEVLAREDEERGAYHFGVLSPGDAVAQVDARGTRVEHVPLRFDRVAVDVAGARVAVTTHDPRGVEALVRDVARALFGDPGFYMERPAFTTGPIERLGSAGLAKARLPAPLTRMRVIACTRELIGEGRERATGSGALALVEEARRAAGGYLPEITLRFDVAGDELPVDVEVRLPNRFRCSAPRWEGLVRSAMESIGMLAPGAAADDAWSLFPVRRPAWRLREALGEAEVAALVKGKALRRALSRNVTTEDLRAQGSNLLTFPVPGEPGAHYAVSSDPSVAARDVTDKDREVLELDVLRLAAMRAKEMKLEGEVRVLGGGAVACLGAVSGRTTALAFAALLRAPAGPAEKKALVEEIKAAAFPAHAVLLVPRGRAWDSGLFEVEYEGLVRGGTALVERAVRLARLENDVEPCRLTDAELVVHRESRRVWFLETPMTVADSGYAFLEGLAMRPGEVATTREVCKWLSRAREDLQAAKATRPKVVRWMAQSFEAAGRKVAMEVIEGVIVVEGKRGYRLGVTGRVF